ncbi:MAG: ABC transporter ATP-binding protein [Verrucomicrobiota bacterium]|nr:ABC transporter ATP-binding protein [Verrucomicrobiota bacterium]
MKIPAASLLEHPGRYRRLYSYLGDYKCWFFLGVFLGVLDAGSQALVPMFFRHIMNSLDADADAFLRNELVFSLLAGIGIVVIFFPAAYYFHVLTSVASARFCRNLQIALHEHVQRLSADFFHRNKVGEVATRLNGDLDIVSGAAGTLSFLAWSVVMMAQGTAMMLWINWQLGLVFVGMMIVVALFTHTYMKHIREMNRKVRDAAGEVSALITEYIALNPLIKSFSREDYAQNKVVRQSDRVRMRREQLWWRQFLYTDLMQVLVRFVAPFTLLFLGAWLMTQGKIKMGDLVAFWGYWLIMGGSLTAILGITTQIFSILASVDRIFEFFNETPRIADRPNAVALTNVKGEITFNDVSFVYPNERGGPVLDHVNLTLKPGERIALVGPSGAGKSTLLQLVLRFYDPVGGAVLLDGVDLRDIQQTSLRQHLGVVMQESVFFAGTVLENMRLANPKATREQVIDALRAANALDFVEEMQGGLHASLGERGMRLSGGQKQRLSIARVFLKNPPVLLFDEATSALDSKSERVVKEAMDRLLHGRTAMIVAHRIATVLDADRIIVMERGRVSAMGTHNELMATCPLYHELCTTQGLK